MEATTCSVDICSRPVSCRGWCEGHYRRIIHTGDLRAEKPLKKGNNIAYREGNHCCVQGCERSIQAAWMCSTHYARWERLGDTKADMPIQPYEQSKQGSNHRGYIVVSVDGVQVRQHRVVMENTLGRKLLPGENVHHKNGVKDDNRPENLELWSTMQPAGQRVDDLLVWAHEIIDRYEDNDA